MASEYRRHLFLVHPLHHWICLGTQWRALSTVLRSVETKTVHSWRPVFALLKHLNVRWCYCGYEQTCKSGMRLLAAAQKPLSGQLVFRGNSARCSPFVGSFSTFKKPREFAHRCCNMGYIWWPTWILYLHLVVVSHVWNGERWRWAWRLHIAPCDVCQVCSVSFHPAECSTGRSGGWYQQNHAILSAPLCSGSSRWLKGAARNTAVRWLVDGIVTFKCDVETETLNQERPNFFDCKPYTE